MSRWLPCAVFAIALASGCAAPVQPMATAVGDKPSVLAQPAPVDRIIPGSSTQADVQALLGPTRSVRFDNGYEVWAYRYPVDGRARPERMAEFVVLFEPGGVVAKTRLRLPPPKND